ncbi:TIGR00725 family protein [Kitasatospora camelliae]|uniref:TIGR00725 family protein n=1 Tax=Kitasatospora camelliae TaxID=3156397 RepID=A0AAU8K842_9ACTN
MEAARAAPYVAVVGPSEAGERQRALARRVGELLADRGAVVLCGGLGGVMEAVCEGAAGRGGTTVGLLPGEDRARGNPYLTVGLTTGLGELRNGLLVRSCDAVLAVGGSWGTLSEVALAVRTGRPVVLLDGWPLPDAPTAGPLLTAATPDQAVDLALDAARRR